VHPVPQSRPPAVRRSAGRPRATSRAELAHVAITLFVSNGFDETSVEDIALAAGVARRTFFRYFSSKADAVWGDFPALLNRMQHRLTEFPDSVSIADALTTAVIEFNAVPASEVAGHRQRMTLILTVPTLLADSTLRFVEWRSVVADFVARRLGRSPVDLLPVTIGYGALGASLAAYERWLAEPDEDLATLLRAAFGALTDGLRGC
jgi:TetR/AcrR family transcriptional regulator, regulator of mycofactocin system